MPRILTCGKRLVRLSDIEKVMRHQRPLLRGWLGRPNFEVTIDGDGIAADDFGGEALREGDRQGRLTRACWSKNNDQEWFRLSRRRSAHSTRAPRNGSAKTKERQGEDEYRQNNEAENLGALTRTVASDPGGIVCGSVGARLGCRPEFTASFYA